MGDGSEKVMEAYIPTVFFTLFFVVDPLGLIPVFLVHLSGYTGIRRTGVILRATGISIGVSIFFILLGRHILNFLGIHSGSFLIAGGIVLFILSLEMLLGHPSGITMRDTPEGMAPSDEDVSVFPLAIPMLCGPGNIAALVMFGSQASGDPVKIAILSGMSVCVFLIAMIVMFFSARIGRALGARGISIVQRLMGLILSAMSVQFIKNGLASLGLVQ